MSERFIKLYTLTAQAAQDGVPAEVDAGALLQDTENDSVLAQIRFKNISGKSIRSMTVNIRARDVNGVPIAQVSEFEYQDIIAAPGETFGDRVPVIMADNNAHSFSVDVKAVKFSDGTVWTKLGDQVAQTAKAAGEQAVKAVKTTTTKIIPLIINIVVFLLLMSFALAFTIVPPDEDSADVMLAVGFWLISFISFPYFGMVLSKKKHGGLLRILRWVLVIVIVALMSAVSRMML